MVDILGTIPKIIHHLPWRLPLMTMEQVSDLQLDYLLLLGLKLVIELQDSHQLELGLQQPAIEAISKESGDFLFPHGVLLLPLVLLLVHCRGNIVVLLVDEGLESSGVVTLAHLPLFEELTDA